jgi:site-specific DNA-methyltransferase (adenine-specific)
MTYKILKGNSLDLLPTLADNSIDAIVTDPPYGLGNPDPDYIIKAIQQWASGDRSHIPEGKGFMGKSWDSFVPPPAIWDECLRVLKPGGHLLAFAGTRTYDLMGISIRMAGFEIRDSIGWVYGSGFPKSLDVSKAIDKAAGAERKLRVNEKWAEKYPNGPGGNLTQNGQIGQLKRIVGNPLMTSDPVTDYAQQWQGWGTALKPALEPIVVARKPLIGTVAENVLTHGTGGLNIDASRIGTTDNFGGGAKGSSGFAANYDGQGWTPGNAQGRWPANLILDEYTAELLDEQSDEASRFFYVAKASKSDRNEGLEDLPEVKAGSMSGGDETRQGRPTNQPMRQNFHPTVKPTALMQYLVKLITPPGGTVLDPFTGSGSTGKAAILEGFDFIGIELTEDYGPIIEGRLKHAEAKVAEAKENLEATPQGLF